MDTPSAACKFMDASGNGWISDAIRCYDYCTNADTQVISNSWGVYQSSAALQVRACLSVKGSPRVEVADMTTHAAKAVHPFGTT